MTVRCSVHRVASFKKILFWGVVSLLLPGALFGEPAPGGEKIARNPPGRDSSVLYFRAGARFSDYRIAYNFLFPLETKVRILPDAGFYSLEARPLREESYLIRLNTFRIRNEGALAEISRRIPFPCPVDVLPARGDFRLEKECRGEENGTPLLRWILLERDGTLLHFLYVAVRQSDEKRGRAILAAIAKNPGYFQTSNP